MIKKIISGGQTGVDLGALMAAQFLELETGGWAPLGWLTEDGPQPDLLKSFGLVESIKSGYATRIEANVYNSDGTLIVYPGGQLTGGSYMTANVCTSFEKPYLVLEWDQWDSHEVAKFFVRHSNPSFNLSVLNIAGPRASKWPEGQSLVMEWLIKVLG